MAALLRPPSAAASQVGFPWQVPACRWGVRCWRPGCVFQHPEGHADTVLALAAHWCQLAKVQPRPHEPEYDEEFTYEKVQFQSQELEHETVQPQPRDFTDGKVQSEPHEQVFEQEFTHARVQLQTHEIEHETVQLQLCNVADKKVQPEPHELVHEKELMHERVQLQSHELEHQTVQFQLHAFKDERVQPEPHDHQHGQVQLQLHRLKDERVQLQPHDRTDPPDRPDLSDGAEGGIVGRHVL